MSPTYPDMNATRVDHAEVLYRFPYVSKLRDVTHDLRRNAAAIKDIAEFFDVDEETAKGAWRLFTETLRSVT
ncbi:MAG TPA: hypothetical protein VIV66_20795 [Pyrinomonadaceae bacterium]